MSDATRPDAACSVCSGPLISCGDSAHPGCDPVDPARFASGGVRTYRGVMAAIHWSICRGCDERIEVGAVQVLADVDGHRVWACEACAADSPAEPSVEPTPGRTAPAAREDRSEPHSALSGRSRPDSTTTEPRRAA